MTVKGEKAWGKQVYLSRSCRQNNCFAESGTSRSSGSLVNTESVSFFFFFYIISFAKQFTYGCHLRKNPINFGVDKGTDLGSNRVFSNIFVFFKE